jgi:hypothetical protein
MTYRDERSENQPTYSTSNEDGNTGQFSFPSLSRCTEIGGEAEVKGGNSDEKSGPKYLFPSSLEHSSKNNNASSDAEQTDTQIQQSDDQCANPLAARSGASHQVFQ